jgi:hypothetical protein
MCAGVALGNRLARKDIEILGHVLIASLLSMFPPPWISGTVTSHGLCLADVVELVDTQDLKS